MIRNYTILKLMIRESSHGKELVYGENHYIKEEIALDKKKKKRGN